MGKRKVYSEADELKKHSRLDFLEAGWRKHAIELQFWEIHHFSNKEKFSGKKEKIHVFVDWCRPRAIALENNQTLERAVEVVRRMDEGMDFQRAQTAAWDCYPIVTR